MSKDRAIPHDFEGEELEMSKADLPKLSASAATVKVTGKLITCEGKDKLRIERVDAE